MSTSNAPTYPPDPYNPTIYEELNTSDVKYVYDATISNCAISNSSLTNCNFVGPIFSTPLTFSGITNNGAFTNNGNNTFNINTSFGPSTSSSFVITDANQTNQQFRVTMCTSNNGQWNPITQSNDVVVSAGPQNAETLSLVSHSSTNSGIRISPTNILIGAGGTTDNNPNTSLRLNNVANEINAKGLLSVTNNGDSDFYVENTSAQAGAIRTICSGAGNFIQSGTSRATTNKFLLFSGMNGGATPTCTMDTVNRRVGINLANNATVPSATLDVVGDITTSGNVSLTGTSKTLQLNSTGGIYCGGQVVTVTEPEISRIAGAKSNLQSQINTLFNNAAPEINSYSGNFQSVQTWTTRNKNYPTDPPTSSTSPLYDVCWSPELKIFVAVSSDSTTLDKVATSVNGIDWITRTLATNNGVGYFSVVWASSLNLFVAVGDGAIDTRVMTSPNGINWTYRSTVGLNSNWNCVTWAPSLGLFCAVSYGQTTRIMTSPDGINWTGRNQPSGVNNAWTSVCWSEDLKIFVAVADGGNNQRAMTSSDGINWIARTNNSESWGSVCWSSQKQLFVAVGTSGSRVMTSPDGITWTTRTGIALNWKSVTWGPQVGLFVATATSGTTNSVMYSADGITWYTSTCNTNVWRGITFSPELGIFVAVSSNTVQNNIMTSSMKGRPPTSDNLYNNLYSNIDENGMWRYKTTVVDGTYSSDTTFSNMTTRGGYLSWAQYSGTGAFTYFVNSEGANNNAGGGGGHYFYVRNFWSGTADARAIDCSLTNPQFVIDGRGTLRLKSGTGNGGILCAGATPSAVTVTQQELSYLSGVTSNIQAQLNSKIGTIADNVSWTPTIQSSGGGSCTYISQQGRYTLVGKACTFSAFISISNVNTFVAGILSVSLPVQCSTFVGGSLVISKISGIDVVSHEYCDFVLDPVSSDTTANIRYRAGLKAGAYSNLFVNRLDPATNFLISFGGSYITS